MPNAKIRYRLALEKKPTNPECGYFVQLPDGGILGGKPPVTTAMTPDGRPLQCQLFSANLERGFDLILQDPGAGVRTVDVYVSDTGKPEYWTPDSPLKPGTILCTLPGVDSMTAAMELGKLVKMPKNTTITLHQGIPKAAFSIGGDLLGRPAPWVFYMIGQIIAKEAGDFWMAPWTKHGSTVMLVNGREILPTNQMPGWGGTGQFVRLEQGLNRIEVYQTASRAEEWMFFLSWAPPYEQFKKPVQNARGVVATDLARSGTARVTAVQNRDSAPIAAGIAEPQLLFWLENEPPLATFKFAALTEGNPPDTKYTWIFPEKTAAEGPEASWIFPAFADTSVTLIAKSPKGQSKSVIPFYATSLSPANLNLPTHNRVFREAVVQMLRSYPTHPNPIQQWTPGHWNNLFRTLEFNKSRDVLEILFQKHGPVLAGNLKPDQILWLQNLLLTELENKDPAAALQWVEFFKTNFRNPEAFQKLKMREAVLAIDSGDFAKAQTLLNAMNARNNELANKAQIRLGDIEFLKGNLNGATAFYSQAQTAAKIRRNAPERSTADLASNAALMKNEPQTTGPRPMSTPGATFAKKLLQRDAVKGLAKSGALQDVSFSENVGTLLEGNYMLEAAEALEQWEEEFPLSKVSGDYILRDAEWSANAGNHKRAVAFLTAYCKQIDASSFLPQAISQLIEYSDKVPESKAQTREVVQSVLNRMKFHPVANRLEEYLKKP